MGNELELHQVIYHILLTQIRFGAFRYRESLPTMEEASELFLVSVGPVRSAYRRLKEEGYITLSKNVGAVVKADFSEQGREENIQMFFGPRRNALTDLCGALRPLFSQIQWLGMKHASPKTLREMELLLEKRVPAPYALLQHLEQRYGALGNDLLMRLFWQIYMFFETPFFSIPENEISTYLPDALQYAKEQDWAGLKRWIAGLYDDLSAGLSRFYRERITLQPSAEQIPFVCNLYQKPMQLCYSLATEILSDISRRDYSPDNLLPTIEQLSRDRGISVSTVRRAYAVLAGTGAIKSTPRIGTRALSLEETAEHCDFSKPVSRKRFANFVQSLQLLALSCRAVALLTLEALDRETLSGWRRQFLELRRIGRSDIVMNVALRFLAQNAPYQALRDIYRELLQQLIWGHPLHREHLLQNVFETVHRPCLDCLIECLEERDFQRFAAQMEAFMLFELRFNVQQLRLRGVREVEGILIPADGESWYEAD